MRPKRHKSSAISERRELLEEGKYRSAAEIADAEGVTRSFVNRMMRLTLLAPEIQEAIIDGRQPKGMQLETLTRTMRSGWAEQRESVAIGQPYEARERALGRRSVRGPFRRFDGAARGGLR
jgi:hypothetical protein